MEPQNLLGNEKERLQEDGLLEIKEKEVNPMYEAPAVIYEGEMEVRAGSCWHDDEDWDFLDECE